MTRETIQKLKFLKNNMYCIFFGTRQICNQVYKQVVYKELKKSTFTSKKKLKKCTFTTQNFSKLILKSVEGHGMSKLYYYDLWVNF